MTAVLGDHYGVLLVGLVALMALGFASLVLWGRRLARLHAAALEFRDRLGNFMQKRDWADYEWLVRRSTAMQAQTGATMAYRAPFGRFVAPNWLIVPNSLHEIRIGLSQPLGGSHANDHAALLNDALLRHMGELENAHQLAVGAVTNPMVWLTRGIITILALPLGILAWTGLLSAATYARFRDSAIVRMVAALVAILSVIGCVVGLVVDWPNFLTIVSRDRPAVPVEVAPGDPPTDDNCLAPPCRVSPQPGSP